MSKVVTLFFAGCLLLSIAQAQEPTHSSTIIVGVGGEQPTRNYTGSSAGPSFSGTYEFRIMKYLSAEGGALVLLPQVTRYGVGPVYSIGAGSNLGGLFGYTPVVDSFRSHSTLLPFGLRGVLPLAHNRLELFAGLGGAYIWNGVGPNALLMQSSAGGRFALDATRHRYWIGTTVRFFNDFGNRRQQWVTYTFDLGFRFGK